MQDADFTREPLPDLALRDFQIIRRLQAQLNIRAGAEIARET
jgi:hypothetical protein